MVQFNFVKKCILLICLCSSISLSAESYNYTPHGYPRQASPAQYADTNCCYGYESCSYVCYAVPALTVGTIAVVGAVLASQHHNHHGRGRRGGTVENGVGFHAH